MFWLKKYYFDGIDESGNTFILYYAVLRLFGIKIPYSSYLICTESQSVQRSIISRSVVGKNNTSFFNKKLKISANWLPLTNSLSKVLLQNKTKNIDWKCCIPKGKFTFEWEDLKFSGLGYCEVLKMNFGVWKLPITTLKWGRFLSENHSLIWIEWIGKHPLKIVFWNGKPIENVQISETGLWFADQRMKLKFENPIILKNEELYTIIKKYWFLKPFFSRKFLSSKEIKYRSKSTFFTENQQETGFSLYETVQWKK